MQPQQRFHVEDIDPEQPSTLGEWVARQRVDFAAIRAKAHRDLDAFLDERQRKMELEFLCIERETFDLTSP